MLWTALGHQPPIWAHVPVLVNEQRKKLSKRRDKVALEQYKDEGILPDAMVNYLMTLGWAPAGDTEIVPWSRIVDEFRLEDVNHSPAFFDVKKLASFNGDYIRAMTIEDFIGACAPVLTSTDAWPADRFNHDLFVQAAPLVQTRVVTLSEVPAMVDFLFLAEPIIDETAWTKTMGVDFARDVLTDFSDALTTAEWNHDALKAILEQWTEARELKLGKTQAPIRVAVTGRTVGPPLFESIELLGREESVRRLTNAIARLG
jgi:glutamyl-tRNA synthetase